MVAPVLLAAGVKALGGLFAANSAKKAEQRAREQAFSEAQYTADENKAALNEQREYDVAIYNRQRADARSDYDLQRADAISDTDNQFVRLRAAAEKGGFNPLAVLQGFPGAGQVNSFGLSTPSMGSGVPLSRPTVGYISPTNYVGGALGDAAMMIGDLLASSPSMSANQKLQKAASDRQTSAARSASSAFRPSVGGVYSKPETPRFGLAVAKGALRPEFPAPLSRSTPPRQAAPTVAYQSHGATTNVPTGPDADEIITGAFIDAYNLTKAKDGVDLLYPGLNAWDQHRPGYVTTSKLPTKASLFNTGVRAMFPGSRFLLDFQ